MQEKLLILLVAAYIKNSNTNTRLLYVLRGNNFFPMGKVKQTIKAKSCLKQSGLVSRAGWCL